MEPLKNIKNSAFTIIRIKVKYVYWVIICILLVHSTPLNATNSIIAVGKTVETNVDISCIRTLIRAGLATHFGGDTRALALALKQNPHFQRYLAETKSPYNWALTPDSENNHRVLTSYLYWFSKQLEKDLVSLQEASLRQSLFEHGYEVPKAMPAREALKAISTRNRERLGIPTFTLADDLDATTKAAFQEVMAKVDLWEPTPIHFSHRNFQEDLTMPIFSMKSLEDASFPSGVSYNAFNREFLRSHNNVFFHAHLFSQNSKSGFKSSYGDNEVILHAATAYDSAWVSADMMYLYELGRFAKAMKLPEFDQLLTSLQHADINTEDWFVGATEMKTLPAGAVSILERIKSHLHLLDFTVQDYEFIVKNQLLHSLYHLAKTNKNRFDTVASNINSNNFSRNVDLFYWEYVFKPLGLPYNFELKVPVAVSPRNFDIKPRQ